MYLRDVEPKSKCCSVCGGARVVRYVLVHPEEMNSGAYLFRCEKCGAFGAFGTGKAADELKEVAEKFAERRNVELHWEEVEIGS